MLVELVGVGDTRHVECFSSAHECPERGTIGLRNDVVWNAIAARIPARGDLASDEAVEAECLRHHDTGALLELDEPLSAFTGPDVALVAVLVLELIGFVGGRLEGLKVVKELDLLVEDLLLGVVATEQLRLCEK